MGNFRNRKYIRFLKNNIWGGDVKDIKLINKQYRRIQFFILLIFSVNMHGLFL